MKPSIDDDTSWITLLALSRFLACRELSDQIVLFFLYETPPIYRFARTLSVFFFSVRHAALQFSDFYFPI